MSRPILPQNKSDVSQVSIYSHLLNDVCHTLPVGKFDVVPSIHKSLVALEDTSAWLNELFLQIETENHTLYLMMMKIEQNKEANMSK